MQSCRWKRLFCRGRDLNCWNQIKSTQQLRFPLYLRGFRSAYNTRSLEWFVFVFCFWDEISLHSNVFPALAWFWSFHFPLDQLLRKTIPKLIRRRRKMRKKISKQTAADRNGVKSFFDFVESGGESLSRRSPSNVRPFPLTTVQEIWAPFTTFA